MTKSTNVADLIKVGTYFNQK